MNMDIIHILLLMILTVAIGTSVVLIIFIRYIHEIIRIQSKQMDILAEKLFGER